MIGYGNTGDNDSVSFRGFLEEYISKVDGLYKL
jgi:hypothetical protein